MNPKQINATAEMIADEFNKLTLADVYLVFKRAKAGVYGELYDRIDGQIILSWFRKHLNERLEASEERSMQAADRDKYEEEQYFDNNRVRTPRTGNDNFMKNVKNAIEKGCKPIVDDDGHITWVMPK